MSTPRDLKPQTYELQIGLDYEDSQGNEFKTTEMVGIPVLQDTDIHIADVEIPTELEVGMSDSLNVDFYNTGRSTIYNLMVRLEGNFETMSSTEYYGNFQPGNSDQYSVMITPIEEGEENGAVIFTYEDVNGDSHEIRKDFIVESIDLSKSPDDGIINPENEQRPFYKSFLFYILILILVLIVAYIIYYRKKNSFKEKYNESLDLNE